jgi:hypothetical protein
MMFKRAVIAVLVVAVAASCGGGGDDSITVAYTVTVERPCTIADEGNLEGIGDSGYGDIPGAEIEVFDGSGTLLGFGNLAAIGFQELGALGEKDEFGQAAGTCTFDAEPFDVKRSEDGIYRVTAGNENRGFLNFNEDDVDDGTLTVFASLG